MKTELLEIIIEAYDNSEISMDDANAYAEFVKCADLTNENDIEILTEMVDVLVPSQCVYYIENGGREIGSTTTTPKKKSKFKAKIANAKAKIAANKGKIAAAAGAAAAVGGAAALGYAGGNRSATKKAEKKLIEMGNEYSFKLLGEEMRRSNADIDNKYLKMKLQAANEEIAKYADKNEELRSKNNSLWKEALEERIRARKKNDALKAAFKQANQAKRNNKAGLMLASDELSKASNELSRALYRNKELRRKNEELELLRKSPEILFPVGQDERRDDVTSGKSVSSLSPRTLAPSSSHTPKLTAADIAAHRKPSQPSSSRPGRKPGQR